MPNKVIPFNKPKCIGNEMQYINQVISSGRISGGGEFTGRCEEWLENYTETQRVLLTNSCTAALELSALLLDIATGDEIIMPSFTFVSTANPFVLRGATPVFVDIREDTLNIDETLITSAISEKTRAIVPVHYAGIACEMNSIMEISEKNNLPIVEDAAQCLGSSYSGKMLGSIGSLGAYSFHDTKNIMAGEGGALMIKDESLVEQAEMIWEKGTNRKKFLKEEVDKYTWQTAGSSFLPSELTAAVLMAQLEKVDAITKDRVLSWNRYHELLFSFQEEGSLKRPVVPDECRHNGHLYYILLDKTINRKVLIEFMRKHNVHVTFHYIPLHSSPAGNHYGRQGSDMRITDDVSGRIVRLPIWSGISESEQCFVVDTLKDAISNSRQ
ncbi:MAG: dTDP-4-amino-4,6-dideoxygalactose transaminase [Gammaproteobacteria bacterium]|jgi:dTDP-4-amino-4,6-dideoxygalactose transaminase